MKKKLLTVALASVSAVVCADVNLYGRLAVGLEGDMFPNSTVPQTGSIQDFGSYFGIRGFDQVYGETSAIWQVEQFLDLTSAQPYDSTSGGGLIVPRPGSPSTGHVSNAVNTLASSESYLGLQGGWGRVRLGNLSNYMRSTQGSVDIYSYANGTDGFGNYSRTSKLVPTSIRFDSPTWQGFNFALGYGFSNNGQQGVSGIGASTSFGGGLNGVYSGGIWNMGAGWSVNNFSVTLGTMIFDQVGSYATSSSGLSAPYQSAAYSGAYANRLELAWNDPDGAIIGVGLQATNGFGWSGWANSGGSFNNYVTNPGFNYAGLNTPSLQTQEIGGSFGWHVGPWTPKIGYMYGNNLMYGGSVWSTAAGSANFIPDSGYQQAVAELDWNITPRTIVFLNYGQMWYGNTLSNVAFCGTGCQGTTSVNSGNAYQVNQGSGAIGFSHTF